MMTSLEGIQLWILWGLLTKTPHVSVLERCLYQGLGSSSKEYVRSGKNLTSISPYVPNIPLSGLPGVLLLLAPRAESDKLIHKQL